MKLKGIAVFKFDDGETHYIGAENENEARTYYIELYGEEYANDVEVTEITDIEELEERFIHVEEGTSGLASLKEVINEIYTFPALLSSSVY